jgi:hypothetical protein
MAYIGWLTKVAGGLAIAVMLVSIWPRQVDAQGSARIRVSATVIGSAGPVEVCAETERHIERMTQILVEEGEFSAQHTIVSSGLAVVRGERPESEDSADTNCTAFVERPTENSDSCRLRVAVAYIAN